MKKIMNGAALIGAVTVMAASSFAVEATKPDGTAKTSAAPAKPAELFEDKVVARGKGVELKQSAVDNAYTLYKANAAAQGQNIPDENREAIQEKLLDRLLVTKLLISRATPEDKAKSAEAVAKVMDDAIKKYETQEKFSQALTASGMTPELFKARVTEQTLCEEVINREVGSKVTVADADAKKYYDENPGQFEQQEKVRAAHILIATADPNTRQPIAADKKKEKEALAKKLKDRADKGEDFAKLATEFSDDPGSKSTGGEYTFGRGQMMAAFEAAAFSLKTNQVSELVETPYGYHIIKLYEKIPATKLEFAKISEDLKKGLKQRDVQKLMPAYIETIKKEANVEIIGAKTPVPAPAAALPPLPNTK
ncbi:MAG: peptidyl-prolyl cis-trans isomerase [Verrucomicrobiales bacterium]|nr:peptidyl-prolyl cis-trans isomerase [Verrucomicrobiales bacterium]